MSTVSLKRLKADGAVLPYLLLQQVNRHAELDLSSLTGVSFSSHCQSRSQDDSTVYINISPGAIVLL